MFRQPITSRHGLLITGFMHAREERRRFHLMKRLVTLSSCEYGAKFCVSVWPRICELSSQLGARHIRAITSAFCLFRALHLSRQTEPRIFCDAADLSLRRSIVIFLPPANYQDEKIATARSPYSVFKAPTRSRRSQDSSSVCLRQ